MKKEDLHEYSYYVLEDVESGERLAGQYSEQHRGSFRICGSALLRSMRMFNVIREIDLS